MSVSLADSIDISQIISILRSIQLVHVIFVNAFINGEGKKERTRETNESNERKSVGKDHRDYSLKKENTKSENL